MPEAASRHFSPQLFKFLRDLKENNRREWFLANKERYENHVRHPAQQFISDFGPHLAKISKHFSADPRPVGGSLFRIYRDVRFSKDKSPYKTHTGIQFRHRRGKDAHAPGFYLHLEPGSVFCGAGIWHPDGATLKKIRDFLVSHPSRWKRVTRGKRFRSLWELSGDALSRPPRGYDPEHPLIDDLKRKDFIAVTRLTHRDVTAPDFLEHYSGLCRAATPFVKYLCEAVDAPF
jgi:uncharacterized protein (TIGR02453 family)